MDSDLFLSLLNACILFKLQLPFECINFFEKEGQRLLSGFSFGFKASLVVFLLFELGDCSTISRVVFVLVTIVIPHIGPLMILEDLPTLLVTDFCFSLSTGNEEELGPLVRLIFS
jgi:hypothetical protein